MKSISRFVIALLLILSISGIKPVTITEASTLSKPAIQVTTFGDMPQITISKVDGATGYRIYRKTEKDTKWVKVSTTKKTSVIDEGWKAEPGTQIKYKVKAYKKGTKTIWSKASTAKTWTVPDKTVIVNTYSDREVLNISRKTLVGQSEFESAISKEDEGIKVPFKSGITVKNTDLLLVTFSAKSNKECAKMKVVINGGSWWGEYPVGVEESDYILPATSLESLKFIQFKFSEGANVSIGNFELANLGTIDVRDVKTGIFNNNDQYTPIDIENGVGYAATDSLYDGKYLYTINSGTLLVYTLENPMQPKVCASLGGLGSTREMALANSGKTLVVSARENGVFLVDISDISKLSIIKNIETLGLATGIYVEDDYCFIGSRRHGLEIYDISNPTNPKFCSQPYRGSEEFFDCSVDNGYLYVSSWAGKKVFVYDVSDVSNPKYVTEIMLDGNAGYCQ